MTKSKIEDLEETRQEIINFKTRLDEKLINKEIPEIEYKVILNEKLGGKTISEVISHIDDEIGKERSKNFLHGDKKRKAAMAISIAIIITITGLLGLLIKDPTLTGMATGETRTIDETITYEQTFTNNTETNLQITNLTSLRISGTLEGSRALIKLIANGTEYVVGEIVNEEHDALITGMVTGTPNATSYTLNTDKDNYSLGEIITVNTEPSTNNVTYYLENAEDTRPFNNNTIIADTVGDHEIIALIVTSSDIIRLTKNVTVTNVSVNLTNTTKVTINESVNETIENVTINETNTTNEYQGLAFNDLCLETCNLPTSTNPTLIIETNGSLTITELRVTTENENRGPRQEIDIPGINLTTNETITIDLNNHFHDVENDVLYYDINQLPEINATISNNVLTINSQNPGIYLAFVYVTDGDKLLTSNNFQIIVTSETPRSESTSNETNIIIPPSECDNRDPNQRPPECIERNASKYFVLEDVFVKDNSRSNVARVTPLGNMLIRGEVREYSNGTPETQSFRVTRTNSDYETITVAWIDSITGDLHLTGKLYEEDFFLTPSRNAFVLQNIRGINLIYIDRNSGDLHLKGNIIKNRNSIN